MLLSLLKFFLYTLHYLGSDNNLVQNTFGNTGLKNTAMPLENNSTQKYEKPVDINTNSSGFSNVASSFSLRGKTFKVESALKVSSGEADLYIVTDESGQKFIFKYYRQDIEPKIEIIEKLKAINLERVIKIIDFGQIDDSHFYELQEYAEGGSLDQFMKNNSGIPHDEIKLIINEIAVCINEIHSKNIIHRDIKPANILIRSFSPFSLVLTDFGIASISEEAIHQTNYNRTISYSAPEAMTGVISTASDYWSLGIITLELLNNCHPFEGLDANMIMYFLTTHNIPGIDSVNNEFEPLVKGLLTQNDKYRWQYKEIKNWLDGMKNIPVYYESKFISDFMKNEKNNTNKTENIKENSELENPKDLSKPFNFNGKNYISLAELSIDMSQNWQYAINCLNNENLKSRLELSVTDPGIKVLLKQIGKNANSYDSCILLEIICAINPEVDFYYMGSRIDEGFLKETAFKILKNTATDTEITTFNELIYGGAIRKYYECTCREREFENSYHGILAECANLKDIKKAAVIILEKLNTAAVDIAETKVQTAEPASGKNSFEKKISLSGINKNYVFFAVSAITALILLALIIKLIK